MATFTWSNGNGGDWSNGGNWGPNGVPGAADTALIQLAGQYAISLDVTEIGSLTLDAAGVTLTPSTTLKLDGNLDVKAGTLTVSQTIQGGTLVADGGTIDYAGGTLDGVTLSGPLDLSATSANVSIKDGISFSGTGPGQILDTGAGSKLGFDGGETLNNVVVSIGGASASDSDLDIGSGLTLGASSTLTTANHTFIYGNDLDNLGSITAATGSLLDYAITTNQGSIAISDGDTDNYISTLASNTGIINVSGVGTELIIQGTLDNFSTINVSGGATLTTQGALDNTSGIITGASGATLDLGGTETSTQLGIVERNGGTFTLGGTLDNTGSTLDITSGSMLDGASLTGTIQGGTIKPDGGAIDYAGVTLSGVTLAGPLDLNTYRASVSIENGISFTGTTPGQILDNGIYASLSFNGAGSLNDVAISLGTTSGDSSIDAGTNLVLGPDSILTTDGYAYIYGTALDNQGSITATVGFLGDYANITNQGSIVIADGNTGNYLNDLISNTGTISVSGRGTGLTIYDPSRTTSIGATSIATGATLTIANPIGALGTVSFLDNTGTLSLDPYNEPSSYGGMLDMFQSGDAIDLGGTGYSLSHTGNTLTVSQGGSIVDTFTLTGQDYTNATFTLTANFDETIITSDAPCFCAGTLILTDRGKRAVEELEVGDLVVTLQDGVETPMSVRWLGQRRVVVAQHPEPEHVDPIRIRRDAVAPGVPARDLFVSPDHALFLDGMLVQARQLVNHMTVTRDTGRAVVTYHHVELDRHAILIADGMPCESYLDGGNRGQFDPQGAVVPLHLPAIGDAQPCAPLATDTALVQPVWQRLAERARAAGHVAPAVELEPDQTPWLEIADGVRLLPCGDGRHFALPPGCLRVRLRSASDRPTTLSPWSDDRRLLGVAVSAVTLHQGRWRQEIPLAGLDGDAGWWPVETAGSLAWRWTDGDAWIDLPEPAEAIAVTLHATMAVAAKTAHRPHIRVA